MSCGVHTCHKVEVEPLINGALWREILEALSRCVVERRLVAGSRRGSSGLIKCPFSRSLRISDKRRDVDLVEFVSKFGEVHTRRQIRSTEEDKTLG